MARVRNFADPSFEPTDEDLAELVIDPLPRHADFVDLRVG
jgi:hypothetical protein